MSESKTSFEARCDILGDFWVEYKADTRFEDFITYNDLGLPLAYATSVGIVKKTNLSENFINETFDLLLEVLGIDEDKGFDSLDDIIFEANGEISEE